MAHFAAICCDKSLAISSRINCLAVKPQPAAPTSATPILVNAAPTYSAT